jgi:enoyl-CoA hydratase/carnithine racemase
MCDIRFAAEGAKFGTGFSRLGLVAEHATSWLLPRLVGQPAALELLLSGRIFLAEEALSMGLVRRIWPKEDLLAQTLTYAKEMADSCSPRSLALIKRQVWADADHDFARALKDSSALTDESLGFPDFKEGLGAYAERRQPRFAGISAADLNRDRGL